MIVITAGHKYALSNFEDKNPSGQFIQFIEKWPYPTIKGTMKDLNMSDEERSKYNDTSLVTMNDGTTNEELLEVLINRMQYLQEKFPCRENAIVITKLEESLMWLNKRTQDRIKRNVEGKQLK